MTKFYPFVQINEQKPYFKKCISIRICFALVPHISVGAQQFGKHFHWSNGNKQISVRMVHNSTENSDWDTDDLSG